jgi:hypothetical protein
MLALPNEKRSAVSDHMKEAQGIAVNAPELLSAATERYFAQEIAHALQTAEQRGRQQGVEERGEGCATRA